MNRCPSRLTPIRQPLARCKIGRRTTRPSTTPRSWITRSPCPSRPSTISSTTFWSRTIPVIPLSTPHPPPQPDMAIYFYEMCLTDAGARDNNCPSRCILGILTIQRGTLRPRVSSPTRIEHPNLPPLNLHPNKRASRKGSGPQHTSDTLLRSSITSSTYIPTI